DMAGANPAQDFLQRRKVEDVAQALAIRLEDDRERAVLAGDREEICGSLPLHPERRALPWSASWQQKRARRVLAEAGGEHRRPAQRAHHELLDLVRLEDQLRLRGRVVRLRETNHDAVVGPQHLYVDRLLLLQPRLDGHCPWRVDPTTE